MVPSLDDFEVQIVSMKFCFLRLCENWIHNIAYLPNIKTEGNRVFNVLEVK